MTPQTVIVDLRAGRQERAQARRQDLHRRRRQEGGRHARSRFHLGRARRTDAADVRRMVATRGLSRACAPSRIVTARIPISGGMNMKTIARRVLAGAALDGGAGGFDPPMHSSSRRCASADRSRRSTARRSPSRPARPATSRSSSPTTWRCSAWSRPPSPTSSRAPSSASARPRRPTAASAPSRS